MPGNRRHYNFIKILLYKSNRRLYLAVRLFIYRLTKKEKKMKISDILGNRRICQFSCSYMWCHLWSTEPLQSNMEPLNWTHPLIVKLIDNFYSFNLTPFPPSFKKERKLSYSWECQIWFFVLFLFVWQIKISFLMVGHTHEDIDQMFSCISRRLSKNNAQSPCRAYQRAFNFGWISPWVTPQSLKLACMK